MEQQKLFYNICNDLWSFAKTLNKDKDSMTDEDWAAAVELMEKTSKLMDTLKSPKGQTQAIQALGALLDHANLMLVRNENTIQSMMTAYLEYERDAIDKREQKGKSILERWLKSLCFAIIFPSGEKPMGPIGENDYGKNRHHSSCGGSAGVCGGKRHG